MCDIRTISTRDPPSVSTITLFPHLEEVGLEDAGVLFLDYISAPNIRSITLRGSREEEVEERQALHVLSNFAYRRNGCPRLQSLALLDVDRLTTENAVACLRRLPSLEHLHLGKAAFTERCEILDYIPISFAQALMRNPAAPASLELLPRLASLHVRVDSPQTESAFLAAVDSRRSPTTGARPELACLTACLMVVDRSWTLDEEDDDIDTEMSVAQRNDGISESESHRIWELTVDQTCTLRTMESKTWRMGQMVCKCREGHNESLIPRVR
ncbi:hypothetical protein BD626DRAFT_473190 [Schizophyllum amplum]|uniref:F-box domain-containing protein n=1 Tax=Schizophyllum amplum TaxID=97359 RepID=A0A550CWL2_9AGAR|nr:hypothetical protein BD626DRAFT_473190 [Auriculariopsis ampla]